MIYLKFILELFQSRVNTCISKMADVIWMVQYFIYIWSKEFVKIFLCVLATQKNKELNLYEDPLLFLPLPPFFLKK